MAENNGNLHLNYIKNHLIPEVLSKLNGETLDTYEIEHSGGLDGFMSALYTLKLKTKTADSNKERLLITKFMKGDVAFRESSKSYIQFANEVYIYATILPAYAKVLEQVEITEVSVDQWVAPAYVAKFGYVEGLSASPEEREAVLVLENLKPKGYALGPRIYLSLQQLLGMCKPLGEYHALSYALRLRDVTQLERLKAGIITLPFINDADPNDAKQNLYRVLYRVAFDRFFDFFDRKIDGNTFDQKSADDLKLIERLRQIREKYFAEPSRLLEDLRTKVDLTEDDRRFAAILHGDYNRNNVLFRHAEVETVKMIDFQELRYGSPAIDVSFFMYINSSAAIRAENWLDILKEYHTHMYQTLSSILKSGAVNLEEVEQQLEYYNFEHFNAHFTRFAFYGVMICLHFLPWLLCNEQECAQLSELFETDMHGEAFHKISMDAGGDNVNVHLLDIMRHACKMGYMDNI